MMMTRLAVWIENVCQEDFALPAVYRERASGRCLRVRDTHGQSRYRFERKQVI